MAHAPLHDPLADPHPNAAREVRNTTCYMCACRCGIRVHLRDGEVRYIEGNPDHPLNQGVICAKGSSGIMKQYSPARLTQPLRRKAGAERGAGEFEEISWDEAFALLTERLAKLRAEDPKNFALFTGRDQMQALTGLFAKQFGTPELCRPRRLLLGQHGRRAHLHHRRLLLGVRRAGPGPRQAVRDDRHRRGPSLQPAQDRHLASSSAAAGASSPSTPSAPATRPSPTSGCRSSPGTDGALLLAIIHEILKLGLYDRDFLVQYTNAARAGGRRPRRATTTVSSMRVEMPTEEGCFDPQNKLWWDRARTAPWSPTPRAPTRACWAAITLEDGTPVKPAFQLLKERVEDYTPEWAAPITGIPAETIRRLAHEMGVTARDQKIELPIPWTDCWDNEHATVTGNPVAFHAMRGLAAHSNGFQTIRALGILMTAAGHHRPPRRLPPQGALSAPHPALSQAAQRPERGAARTPRWTACRSAGRPSPRTCSSTTTARRCASTRPSPGSIRWRCMA